MVANFSIFLKDFDNKSDQPSKKYKSTPPTTPLRNKLCGVTRWEGDFWQNKSDMECTLNNRHYSCRAMKDFSWYFREIVLNRELRFLGRISWKLTPAPRCFDFERHVDVGDHCGRGRKGLTVKAKFSVKTSMTLWWPCGECASLCWWPK